MEFRERMRLCVITPYYHPIKGGITSYVSYLVKTFQENTMTVDIITRLGEKQEGITAIKTNKMFFILKTYMLLHKNRYDIIHSHSHWYTLAPSVLYKFFSPKTRIVHTFHTEPFGMMKGLKKKMFEWLLSKCDIVTFVSGTLMKKVEKNLKLDTKTKKKVVYAGVSEHEVRKEEVEEFKAKYRLNGSSPILSFVGPLVWKMKVEGVKMLVRAFKYVIKEHPNAKLLIIGDGEYKEDVERLVKELNIENNIIFTGFFDDVFVPLSITDIYTHISLQEGFPLSLLEAMSIGKPVIATKVGGIPELITDGENGILVDSEPRAIANTILELYSDEEKRKRLGEEAKKTVKINYNWSKIAEEFMEIYKNGGDYSC